ncbi:MAG TPA: hypothetical protein VLH38_00320 [Patescibacteria group bacterium]|nr:hypothetical protein [Patescibacteria group bacterium]
MRSCLYLSLTGIETKKFPELYVLHEIQRKGEAVMAGGNSGGVA